jgi:hypothetical protein
MAIKKGEEERERERERERKREKQIVLRLSIEILNMSMRLRGPTTRTAACRSIALDGKTTTEERQDV